MDEPTVVAIDQCLSLVNVVFNVFDEVFPPRGSTSRGIFASSDNFDDLIRGIAPVVQFAEDMKSL